MQFADAQIARAGGHFVVQGDMSAVYKQGEVSTAEIPMLKETIVETGQVEDGDSVVVPQCDVTENGSIKVNVAGFYHLYVGAQIGTPNHDDIRVEATVGDDTVAFAGFAKTNVNNYRCNHASMVYLGEGAEISAKIVNFGETGDKLAPASGLMTLTLVFYTSVGAPVPAEKLSAELIGDI